MSDSMWVSVHHPLQLADPLPAERRVVAVWLANKYLPFCGYVRYAAGDRDSPYFVVYHGNTDIGAAVIAWCDCLPDDGPPVENAAIYSQEQASGRGFKARKGREGEQA